MITNGSSLFGRTRGQILSLLLGHPDESFYLRQVVRLASVGLGAAQRELRYLWQAGIIQRTVQGRQVYFQASRQSPLFTDLQGLVLKTVGVAGVLKGALSRLEKSIEVAFLFGSLARGTSDGRSDIDVMLVGNVSFGEVVASLASVQEQLMSDINPVVFPRGEFRQKLAHGDHFLITVLREPKIFLIGSDYELSRLGKNGWIKAHSTSREEIAALLGVVDRDLSDSQTRGLSADWKLSIAYNAALQAATAALAAAGYRAGRDAHHYRVIQSLQLTVAPDHNWIDQLEKFRKKRNIGGYERAGAVSDKEAKEMIHLAQQLTAAVKKWLTKKYPKLMK